MYIYMYIHVHTFTCIFNSKFIYAYGKTMSLQKYFCFQFQYCKVCSSVLPFHICNPLIQYWETWLLLSFIDLHIGSLQVPSCPWQWPPLLLCKCPSHSAWVWPCVRASTHVRTLLTAVQFPIPHNRHALPRVGALLNLLGFTSLLASPYLRSSTPLTQECPPHLAWSLSSCTGLLPAEIQRNAPVQSSDNRDISLRRMLTA